ncbi:hypothetical protein [Actinomycetospora sp. NBRC 106378]|uniref:hypothetical protein n=1 Tax=Actinomycetospora sp. NBRC 106378 TaxID=3032208 RepID=UPI0024A303A5|nr:hypothetical protein [Actinomycetospora sp. NBRC 106378]GLZ51380.1 hypothetical protein Acsp07_09970 [Actinomycetospora sp. NBRC 106378]
MTEPVPPGLYTQPPQGPPPWLPARPLQASDPTVLTTGQVVPREAMPVTPAADAFTVDLEAAPGVLRELYAARDELQQVRMDALRLRQIDPGTQDEVSRDAASVLGAIAAGGSGSLVEAVNGGIARLGQLIGALEAELASYQAAEQENRGRLL